MKKRKILIPIVLIASEVLITMYKYDLSKRILDANYPFSISDALFIWGVLFFFLAMAIMFGVENRYVFALFSNKSNTYGSNVANFIEATSKNFNLRFNDFPTGLSILSISILNFIGYFVTLIL